MERMAFIRNVETDIYRKLISICLFREARAVIPFPYREFVQVLRKLSSISFRSTEKKIARSAQRPEC